MNFIKNVPQGYVYTTPRNTQYQKCGNDWINCSTGIILESSKNPKMELAAKHQILECNEFTRFKVGEHYNVGNSVYMYIGEKNFTMNGSVLHESASRNIYETLTEDDEKVDNVKVPLGYIYKTDKGTEYQFTNKGWKSLRSENFLNSSASKSLEDAAKRKIAKHNADSPIAIGDEWKSKKGNTYIYIGDGIFVSPDGKRKVPKHISDQIMAEKQHEYDTRKNAEAEAAQKANGTVEPEQSITEPTQEPEVKPEQSTQEPEVKQHDSGIQYSGSSSLDSLAKAINNHPSKRKIVILLGRGDEVSLLAADILLSGKTKEAVDILNSLK